MWPLCTANNLLWILLPLLIGFLTGWWIWARRSAGHDSGHDIDQADGRIVAPPVRGDGELGRPAPAVVPLRRDHVAASDVNARLIDEPKAMGASDKSGSGAAAIGIAPAVGKPDDLKLIKGIGPKLDDLLQRLGVRRFDQIAAWSSGDVAKVDQHLGAFRGRIDRDSWIDQAKLLARGAFDEFEARFGGNGSPDQ